MSSADAALVVWEDERKRRLKLAKCSEKSILVRRSSAAVLDRVHHLVWGGGVGRLDSYVVGGAVVDWRFEETVVPGGKGG